jgi:hypothetical protein
MVARGRMCVVRQLAAQGLKGQALLDVVMRLTGLPQPDAQLLINVELYGLGDTGRVSGPTIFEVRDRLVAEGYSLPGLE